MAKCLPMAVKDAARSSLLNLPEDSVSSWSDLRGLFVANFEGTHEHPLSVNDLFRVKQHPGETLHKYIQRFSHVLNKIPHATDEIVIMVFTNGVNDLEMCKKLAVNNTLRRRSRIPPQQP